MTTAADGTTTTGVTIPGSAGTTPGMTTGGTTYQEVPAALQQIYQSAWDNLGSQLATPYTAYAGPRVADLSPEQQQASALAQMMPDALSGIYGDAQTAINNVPTISGTSYNADLSNYNFDTNRLQQANTDAVDPNAMNLSTSAWTQHAGEYLNPYEKQVTDNITNLANRNLMETVLPGVNQTFTTGGQFGGTRSADFTNRAIRNNQEAIIGGIGNTMNASLGTMGNLFTSDTQRALDAQKGTASNQLALGNLGVNAVAENNRSLLTGEGLNQATQSTNAQLGSAANAFGAKSAYEAEAANQLAAQNQGTQLLALGSGLNTGMNTAIGNLGATGALSQLQDQKSYDAAYQEFLNGQNYNLQNTQNVLNVANTSAPSTVGKTTAGSYITPGTSTAGQVIGGLGAAAQIYKNTVGG